MAPARKEEPWITTPNQSFGSYGRRQSGPRSAAGSEGARSAQSGASCSSYTTFGPRKGRKVTYDCESSSPAETAHLDRSTCPSPIHVDYGHLVDEALLRKGQYPCYPGHPNDFSISETCPSDLNDVADLRDRSGDPFEAFLGREHGGRPQESDRRNQERMKLKGGAYTCAYCGKGFTKSWQWSRHEQSVNAPTQAWVCDAYANISLDT